MREICSHKVDTYDIYIGLKYFKHKKIIVKKSCLKQFWFENINTHVQ